MVRPFKQLKLRWKLFYCNLKTIITDFKICYPRRTTVAILRFSSFKGSHSLNHCVGQLQILATKGEIGLNIAMIFSLHIIKNYCNKLFSIAIAMHKILNWLMKIEQHVLYNERELYKLLFEIKELTIRNSSINKQGWRLEN